ncbi:TetR/AcrR family transcriptional regulator [Paenibacillus cellulositrophicus]|uniref:TetR/AcrR family transcriptional regulator n=1 Tax=Paenibacillus TaxID=44249 RepID=UPI000B7D5194|nr:MULTISPECIES: TetR/AcrR family transcriptional regulator [Paenibacillus]MCM3001558.1 TetR/AcrR family transcriptional regulator [Paenibacillus cellulositrophicus]OXL85593.1 TetR family transcriptional regulator [Paenibacillus sp. SSG-1]RED32463.1 TetR family transcriptional regulator [Paenibacillus sp. VMFN-D1]UYO06694.1 TetR/AcrR family transcriptional regulator [Paenibacillus sp. PSB04]
MSKEKILHAATRVFSEYGYHRASMDEIAQQAQVAKGTLYYNFPGKSQLFKAVVKAGFEDIMERTKTDLSSALPIKEQILRVLRHHLDLFLDSRHFAHIVFNEISNGIEPDVLDELKQLRREHLSFLAGILREAQCEGGIMRDVDADLAAASTIGMLESTCNYYLSHQEEYSREDLESFVFTVVAEGLFKSLD